MKRILLTGASGFIGKNIKESFLSDKYEIFSPSSEELNLVDTNCVDDYFKEKQFDVVLHSATKPGHRNAKDCVALTYSNIRMFMNLERHKDKYGKFINFGSGAIYDNSKNIIDAKEEAIFKNFGESEHSFCKYVIAKQIESHNKFIDLNIFGIFGKYEDYSIRFISNAICKSIFDLPITLRQNRKFSYLYIDDLMPILDYMIEHEMKYSSYNVVPDEKIDLLEIAEYIKIVTNNSHDISVKNDGYGLEYTGSNFRVKGEFLSIKFTKIQDTILRLYEYYKENRIQLNKGLLYVDK